MAFDASAPIKYAPRVKQACQATNQADLNLLQALAGFRSLGASFSDGDQVGYVIEDGSASPATAWEIGIGVVSNSGTTLIREFIIDTSTRNGAPLSFPLASQTKLNLSSANHVVFCDVPAQLLISLTLQGALSDAGSVRSLIVRQTMTALQAETDLAQAESVFVLGVTAVGDGRGGWFRWDANDASAPDGIDTFRLAGSSVGLLKRVLDDLQRQPLTYATRTAWLAVDAAATVASGRRAIIFGDTSEGDIAPFSAVWDAASTATPNGATVFRPTAGAASTGAGRWLRAAASPARTFTAGVAEPSVAGGEWFRTSGPGALTGFSGGFEGQSIVIERGDADVTLRHDPAKLLLGGVDLVLSANSAPVVLRFVGGVWRLIGGGGVVVTSAARSLLAQASEGDMRAFLQLGTAATMAVPSAGVNASATQVVRGDDTRVLAGGAGGVNRVLNWDFADGLTGWLIPSAGSNTTGLPLTSGTNYAEGGTTYGRASKPVAFARITGSPAAGTIWDILGPSVHVSPGERLSYSAEVAYHRCAVPRVRLFGFDAAGVSQGELTSVTGGTLDGGVNGENMARVAGFVDLPNNTMLRSVRIQVLGEGTGEANPLLLVTRAAVQAVSAGTSVHPPQAPGPASSSNNNLLDTTGYNTGRVQESKAPVYMPAWITPAKVGAVGDGVTDDTAAFQTMLNDGRPVCLTQPSVAWRLSSINVPARRQIFADGIRPPIRHFGSNPLWVVQGSNVRVGDFYVECGTGYKADTGASIVAIDCRTNNIERVDMQNIIGVWTGGVFSDIGLVGQYDEVRIEKVLTILQRGVGIRLLRSFAGFWTDLVFMEWLRGQPGTANGGLYLDETVSDINQPMVQVGSNQTAGAGGQLFMRTYCQGANRTDAPNNHGYLLTGPAGGVRLQWCDVDGAGGDAFNATFFDEIELYDVRFTSIWGHGIVLDEASNVRGTARISGRLGNTNGSRPNRHAVYIKRDCARVDIDVTATSLTGTPRRIEGRDLFNDFVSTPNRTRRGNESINISVDDGSQVRGGELLDPAITYLTAPFGITATGTPDVQVTGPVWASGGTGGQAAVGRVAFGFPRLLSINTYTRHVLRFNQTTAASVNPYLQFRLQPLELLSEQWVTIDFWARCETAQTTLLARLWKIYGTGGSANESVADEDVVVDATWRQFSRSFRAPSSFGKTFGPDSYGFVGLYLPVSVTREVDFALVRVRWGSDAQPLRLPVNGLTFS